MPESYRPIPQDVFLFRDSRPFEAGSVGNARSVGVLPPPETLYGALRTAILAFNAVPASEMKTPPGHPVLGWHGGYGTLAIQSCFLEQLARRESTLYLPRPADLFYDVGMRRYDYLTPAGSPAMANLPGGLRMLRPS